MGAFCASNNNLSHLSSSRSSINNQNNNNNSNLNDDQLHDQPISLAVSMTPTPTTTTTRTLSRNGYHHSNNRQQQQQQQQQQYCDDNDDELASYSRSWQLVTDEVAPQTSNKNVDANDSECHHEGVALHATCADAYDSSAPSSLGPTLIGVDDQLAETDQLVTPLLPPVAVIASTGIDYDDAEARSDDDVDADVVVSPVEVKLECDSESEEFAQEDETEREDNDEQQQHENEYRYQDQLNSDQESEQNENDNQSFNSNQDVDINIQVGNHHNQQEQAEEEKEEIMVRASLQTPIVYVEHREPSRASYGTRLVVELEYEDSDDDLNNTALTINEPEVIEDTQSSAQLLPALLFDLDFEFSARQDSQIEFPELGRPILCVRTDENRCTPTDQSYAIDELVDNLLLSTTTPEPEANISRKRLREILDEHVAQVHSAVMDHRCRRFRCDAACELTRATYNNAWHNNWLFASSNQSLLLSQHDKQQQQQRCLRTPIDLLTFDTLLTTRRNKSNRVFVPRATPLTHDHWCVSHYLSTRQLTPVRFNQIYALVRTNNDSSNSSSDNEQDNEDLVDDLSCCVRDFYINRLSINNSYVASVLGLQNASLSQAANDALLSDEHEHELELLSEKLRIGEIVRGAVDALEMLLQLSSLDDHNNESSERNKRAVGVRQQHLLLGPASQRSASLACSFGSNGYFQLCPTRLELLPREWVHKFAPKSLIINGDVKASVQVHRRTMLAALAHRLRTQRVRAMEAISSFAAIEQSKTSQNKAECSHSQKPNREHKYAAQFVVRPANVLHVECRHDRRRQTASVSSVAATDAGISPVAVAHLWCRTRGAGPLHIEWFSVVVDNDDANNDCHCVPLVPKQVPPFVHSQTQSQSQTNQQVSASVTYLGSHTHQVHTSDGNVRVTRDKHCSWLTVVDVTKLNSTKLVCIVYNCYSFEMAQVDIIEQRSEVDCSSFDTANASSLFNSNIYQAHSKSRSKRDSLSSDQAFVLRTWRQREKDLKRNEKSKKNISSSPAQVPVQSQPSPTSNSNNNSDARTREKENMKCAYKNEHENESNNNKELIDSMIDTSENQQQQQQCSPAGQRERTKWTADAVPLDNAHNPYSVDNLRARLAFNRRYHTLVKSAHHSHSDRYLGKARSPAHQQVLSTSTAPQQHVIMSSTTPTTTTAPATTELTFADCELYPTAKSNNGSQENLTMKKTTERTNMDELAHSQVKKNVNVTSPAPPRPRPRPRTNTTTTTTITTTIHTTGMQQLPRSQPQARHNGMIQSASATTNICANTNANTSQSTINQDHAKPLYQQQQQLATSNQATERTARAQCSIREQQKHKQATSESAAAAAATTTATKTLLQEQEHHISLLGHPSQLTDTIYSDQVSDHSNNNRDLITGAADGHTISVEHHRSRNKNENKTKTGLLNDNSDVAVALPAEHTNDADRLASNERQVREPTTNNMSSSTDKQPLAVNGRPKSSVRDLISRFSAQQR